MKAVSALAAAAALAMSLSACSSAPTPAPAPTAVTVAGTISESLVTATATVEKIDLASRHVTLRGADGNSMSMKVSQDVRNLAQVKVGDEVQVSYYESLAYEVRRPGTASAGVAVAAAAGRAASGQMPGAGAATATTVTVTIEAIDRTSPSVTLRGPDGSLAVVKVRDPSKLDHVAVGDLVEITYTEALAASVEPKR